MESSEIEYKALLSNDEDAEEIEEVLPPADIPNEAFDNSSTSSSDEIKLGIAFFLMVIVGTSVSVLNKVVTIPFYNYPNFLNMYALVAYLVLCFSFVLPTIAFGTSITQERLQVPKLTFVLMGFLDTLGTSLQTFASVYLSGPFLIMLPQAAIPFSMIFSRHIKGERFHKWQYMGAIIVILGILLVIEPMLSGRNSPEYICETNAIIFDPDEYCIMCQKETNQDSCLAHIDKTHHQTLWNDTTIHFCQWIQQTDDNKSGEDDGLVKLWALVVILSCIPMTLSSLYKEMVLSEVELHPLYLNGWTAFFQFFFSLALAIPAGKLTSPPLSSSDLMSNLHNGWSCYFNAQGSIDTGCHPDDMCEQAFWIFNLNFVMVVLYTILAIYLLKYGSTSLLYLASTITVPLGNIVFSIQSIPGYTPMHLSDILGLIVIVTGLVLYRSAAGALKEDDMINPTTERSRSENTHSPDNTSQPTMACTETTDSLQEPLLS